mmetsp:Transcript_54010/g.115918  ORF Transcript_54010/g.115918 Transcript_54010/m.115918 type:complete len:222 (-) Transcript_54010:933-1598(-)
MLRIPAKRLRHVGAGAVHLVMASIHSIHSAVHPPALLDDQGGNVVVFGPQANHCLGVVLTHSKFGFPSVMGLVEITKFKASGVAEDTSHLDGRDIITFRPLQLHVRVRPLAGPEGQTPPVEVGASKHDRIALVALLSVVDALLLGCWLVAGARRSGAVHRPCLCSFAALRVARAPLSDGVLATAVVSALVGSCWSLGSHAILVMPRTALDVPRSGAFPAHC